MRGWTSIGRRLLEKCNGLNAAQLKERPVATSSLSLLGIVRHMTFVEQIWFENRFGGRETSDYYKTDGDRDADFNDLDDTAVENVFILYDRRSTSRVEGGPRDTISMRWPRELVVVETSTCGGYSFT